LCLGVFVVDKEATTKARLRAHLPFCETKSAGRPKIFDPALRREGTKNAKKHALIVPLHCFSL